MKCGHSNTNLFGIGVRPEKIDMPVRANGQLQMMRQTGAEPTGTVGAADVPVESRLKLQATKLADRDGRSFSR